MNVNKDPFSFKAAYREFLDIPKSNLPIIFGLRPISKATYSTGKFISAKTNGFVQLDTFIPNYMRKQSRYFGGYVIAPCNDFVGNFLKLHVLKNTDEQMLSSVFSAPLVEESVYRLPLILLYTKINKRSMEVLKQPTNGSKNLDRMTNKKFVRILTQVNGGGAIKAIAILFSSTVFTYGHGENLNPGRSLSLFVGSLALSKVALGSHYGIGLLGAMAAHSIHNVSCQYFSTGGEIGVFLDKKTGKPKTEELA